MRCNIRKCFTEHPKSVNETYFQHLVTCLKIIFRLLFSSFILLLHGLFPFFIPPRGTDVIALSEFLYNVSPTNRKESSDED